MTRKKRRRPDTPHVEERVEPREIEDDGSELLPQWNTATDEPYFVRESDGLELTSDEAGAIFDARNNRPTRREIAEQDAWLLERQRRLRAAAERVAARMSLLPAVGKVVLFGSVARPLCREVPRFSEFRRARIELWHECKDVDLAVWWSGDAPLNELRLAVAQGLLDDQGRQGELTADYVDVFVMCPQTGRCLGRLCRFRFCPRHKRECADPGCGETPFLRPDRDFVLDWAEASKESVVLFERKATAAG